MRLSSQVVSLVEGLYPRRAFAAVTAALSDTRVVVINGARQSGKSTLARLVAQDRDDVVVRFLDDATTRAAAVADPGLFVRHDGLLVIDEVQRVPELMLAIKHDVDLDPRPDRFLLTGSARLLALQSIPDLLPGRSETIELWPLAQGEIDGTTDRFVEQSSTEAWTSRSPRRRRAGPSMSSGHFVAVTRRLCGARTWVGVRASSRHMSPI